MSLREQLQRTLGSAFTLEGELGGGGMSRVFVADEKAYNRRVVIKVLPPELTQGVSVERFKREIQLAAQLQHPHIVPVHTSGETEGLPYYTMPFVEGVSLRARLASGPMSIAETVGILREVAKALAYAHERGIVHRDIKPDNILLTSGSAVVTDFGIARALSAARSGSPGSTLTQIGTSIGTPAYMAPEQAAADPSSDHRADIYSFGCTAYEMLTGQPPFSGKSPHKLLAAHMGEVPESVANLRPDTPSSLSALVMACLAKDPADRPTSAAEIVRALEMVGSGPSHDAAPQALLGRVSLGKALSIYAVAFLAVALVARVAIVRIGLPDWVFPGALLVMALLLPAILFTWYAHYATRRAYVATPTYTPGGTAATTHGTMATIALKASPHVSWKRTTRWSGYALGGFVLLVGAAMLLRYMGVGPFASLLSAGTLQKGDRIVVDEFTVSNSPDSLGIGRALSSAVKADLGQSTNITILDETSVNETLQRMRKRNAPLLLAVAQEVAVRTGAKAIVDGTLTPVGTGYLIQLRLVSADSLRELASERGAADSPSQLIEAVGKLTKKLRAKMGESLRSVQSSPALASVTTTSLTALRKYAEASRIYGRTRDPADYFRLMREAIAEDSTFASAYYSIAQLQIDRAGSAADAASLLAKAYKYRERLTPREQLILDRIYYAYGPLETRDPVKTVAASESLYARYGGAYNANSVGVWAAYLGDYAKAESMYHISAALDSTYPYPLGNLASLLAAQGRRAAWDSAETGLSRRVPPSGALTSQALLKRGRGDLVGAERLLRTILDSVQLGPAIRAGALRSLNGIALTRGALREAESLDERLPTLDPTELNADSRIMRGVNRAYTRRTVFGDTSGAVRILDSIVAHSKLDSIALFDRPYSELARAYSLAGRPDKARIHLAGLQKQYRENDPSFGAMITLRRAEIAMAEGRWDDAIKDLQRKRTGRCYTCWNLPRAMAFDARGDRDSAIVAYEAYVNQILTLGANFVVAHRRLGELYHSKGDIANAIARYEKFVELWKNADPELQPQVADVRKRIAALQALEKKGR